MGDFCFSLSAVPIICLGHVDRVRETASRAWSCCALITRFKGSCVFSPFRWQRRGKNVAPPQLDSCAPDPNENDISPLTFTVLAPAGHFYEKGDGIWPKKPKKNPNIFSRGQTRSLAFTWCYFLWWLQSAAALLATRHHFFPLHLRLHQFFFGFSVLP